MFILFVSHRYARDSGLRASPLKFVAQALCPTPFGFLFLLFSFFDLHIIKCV